MSQHVEWMDATYTAAEVVPPGTTIGADQVAERNHALVLGLDNLAVIEGDLAALAALAQQITAQVTAAQTHADEPRYGTCEVCGQAVTDHEDRRLRADTDFVEHHGHLIRRLPNGSPTSPVPRQPHPEVEVVIPDAAWEPAGDDDEPGGERAILAATIVLNGTRHHAVAYQVNGSDPQTAIQHDGDLDAFNAATGGDGPFATITIDGHDYAVFTTPFSR